MDVHAQCPHCSRPFLVPARFAGKHIKCPRCGGAMPVPGPQAAPSAGAPASRPGIPPSPSGFAAPTGYPAQGYPQSAAVPQPTIPQFPQQTPGYPASAPGYPAPQTAYPTLPASSVPTTPPESLGSLGPLPGSARKRKARDKKILTIVLGAAGGLAVLVILILIVSAALRGSGSGGAAPAAPAQVAAVPPNYGPRVALTSPQPGVRWSEVRLSGTGQPGHSGRLWVYLPEGSPAPRSLACVVIAPAGTNLLTGMGLGEGDQAEHWPYAQAGFAVVAYELDGALRDPENASPSELREAYRQFSAAGAGLVNARNALNYARTQIPEVDPNRLYVAGHSSAATLAILVAENEPVRGCIAFAPCTDVPARLAEAGVALQLLLPGAKQFSAAYSPHTNADKLRCPLFLFHARDDSNVSFGESQRFADLVRRSNGNVTLAETAFGEHYDSMVREGMPRAIQWLRTQGGSPAAPPTNSGQITPAPYPASPPNARVPSPTMPEPADFASHAAVKDQNPFPASRGLVAVVRFQILGFTGSGDQLQAARQALAGIPWADPGSVTIDQQSQELVVGVRVMAVNTAPAKSALTQAGFRIGATGLRPTK